MKIVRFTHKGRKGIFIEMDAADALALASSLCMQVSKQSPNGERREFHTHNGEYFSIGVIPKKD